MLAYEYWTTFHFLGNEIISREMISFSLYKKGWKTIPKHVKNTRKMLNNSGLSWTNVSETFFGNFKTVWKALQFLSLEKARVVVVGWGSHTKEAKVDLHTNVLVSFCFTWGHSSKKCEMKYGHDHRHYFPLVPFPLATENTVVHNIFTPAPIIWGEEEREIL